MSSHGADPSHTPRQDRAPAQKPSAPAFPISRFVTELRCLRCGRTYRPGEIDYVCPEHANQGSDLGTLDVRYDYARIKGAVRPETIAVNPDRSIARYGPLLPLADTASLPPYPVGDTPLLHAVRLGKAIGLPRLYIKDDGRNPSASFKDRASAVAVARAQEEGRAVIATASTGNAAAALAAMSAAAGRPAVIFVPKSAPPAKIAQLLAYGSRVLAVDGSYDQAFDLCRAACEHFGWYNRNTGFNPYMTEGKKTVAFEIAEQLAAQSAGTGPGGAPFHAPDVVLVSVGDGCIIGGVHKGFHDLLELGWIEKMPRIIGVQAERSAALYHAWQAGLEIPEPVAATTRADSINVDAPRDPVKALNAVRKSGGAFVVVDDQAILQAVPALARGAAVFAEPAGATAYAGLLQAYCDGLVTPEETIVAINTGSGLKDIQAVMQVAGEATVIPPTLAAVEAALAETADDLL